MVTLAGLWLPILLSAVFVFVVSSILHMVIPIHKNDVKKMSGESEVLTAMRKQGVGRGDYMFPFPPSMKEMASPEMQAKYKEGPVGFMTVLDNGTPTMGKSLTLWFFYSIMMGIFAGYVGTFCLDPGAHYLAVFRLTGTVAVLGYAAGTLQNSIWKGQSWSVAMKFVFDGILYGLVTAGTFGWLWPAAG